MLYLKRSFAYFIRYPLIIFIVIIDVQAQEPASFFPHHLGDIWEYVEVDMFDWSVDTLQSTIVSDSLDSLNRAHVYFELNYLGHSFAKTEDWPQGNFIIDSQNNVYSLYSFGLPYFLIYRLDAQQGDQWVMYKYGPDSYDMARCDRVDTEYIFGEWRQTKYFSYYFASDSADTTGLVHYYSTLAEGLGMIYNGGTHDAGYHLYLKGAVIDGVLYGDTTLVSIADNSQRQIPEEFELSHNFPNPFNSSTSFKLILHHPSVISMNIYDVNGKEVKKIIENSFLNAGKYQIRWAGNDKNGKSLSSGIYFYEITNGKINKTGRLIMIR